MESIFGMTESGKNVTLPQQQQSWNAFPAGRQQQQQLQQYQLQQLQKGPSRSRPPQEMESLPSSLKWPPPMTAEVKPTTPKAAAAEEDKSEKKVSIVDDREKDDKTLEQRKKRRKRREEEEDIFDLPKGVYDPNSENLLGFVDLLQMEKGKTFQVSHRETLESIRQSADRLTKRNWPFFPQASFSQVLAWLRTTVGCENICDSQRRHAAEVPTLCQKNYFNFH